MRVCLVYPPYGKGRRSRYFPFGLAYVAASLRDAGHEVFVVDMEGDDLDPGRALEAVCSIRPDIVGFGGMVTRFRFVKEMGRELRKRLPGAFLIAGNSGATTIPEIYIESCSLDAVVLGEGERTSCELAEALEHGGEWRQVRGLAFHDGLGIVRSSPREQVKDLDALPWPAWDLFPIERYVNSFDHRQKLVRHLEVVASRGCPFDCVYCYRIYGRRVRRRSPASIVAEAEELVRRFDIRYTGFPDDLFTSDRDFVMEFCRLFRERLPGLKWSCLGRVNTVDPEMLAEMKRAGCDWISYGIESGSDAMLRAMNRGVTAEQCLNAVRMTRKAGIHPDGSFMIGMYGETAETVEETVRFCRRADLTAPMLFVTPYPGTAVFDRAVSEGRIHSVEDLVTRMNAADDLLVNLTDMPDDELVSLRNRAQRRIGLGYLARRPFSRVPRLLCRHFLLSGWRGLARDLFGLLGVNFSRRRTRERA